MDSNCTNCPGGSNLVHRTNPNPDITTIITEGNVVLHPQRLNPGLVPFDELFGIFGLDATQLVNGTGYVWRWVDTRTYGPNGEVTGGECGFALTEPDDCGEFPWEPSNRPEPAVTGAERPGDVAINRATGCVSHIFCNGRWLCIGGSTGQVIPGDPTNEIVCYPDLSGQDYSAGCGEWLVFGTDQMTGATCGDERITNCPSGLQTSTDYGSFSGAGPSAGWNSLTWTPVTAGNPTPDGATFAQCDTVITSDGDGDPRREFRAGFNIPSGSSCPLIFTADITQGSGALSFGFYDTISNANLPVTALVAAPAGASIVSGPTGDVVQISSGQTGPVEINFGCPAGVDLANVRLVVFNVGGGSGETVENLRVEFTQSAGVGCFSWPTINSLANWLNQNDPNGGGWMVINGEVCKTVGVGQGAAYGTLGGCDTSANPTIESV